MHNNQAQILCNAFGESFHPDSNQDTICRIANEVAEKLEKHGLKIARMEPEPFIIPMPKEWVNPLLEFLNNEEAKEQGKGPFTMEELFGCDMVPVMCCAECGAVVPYERERQNHVAWHNKVADL